MRRSSSALTRDPPFADDAVPAATRQPYFLIVDDRFRVPIFVFVELEPKRPFRKVTIEFAPVGPGEYRCGVGIGSGRSLARHAEFWDRYKEFSTDRQARAAGYVPVEPRYIGPSWESYLAAFRPEGERPLKVAPGPPAGRSLYRAVRD
jgi:hypothetical protein